MVLNGQVAIITGTGPNIGGEIARTLARNGARVACVDRERDRAEHVADEVRRQGHSALAVSADITSPSDVERIVRTVVAEYGEVNILVNNAAITHREGILDTSYDTWRRVTGVVLDGTFLCSQHVANQMVTQGKGGAIVNVASTSGHRGGPTAVAYATAKGGILNLTRAMAVQLAPHGIRVNTLTPTQTGIPVAGGPSREEGPPPKSIPLGRWGRPGDQAEAILFLVSPGADFVTGADLNVDGGLLAAFPVG